MSEKHCGNQETTLGPSHSKAEERKEPTTGSEVAVIKEEPAELDSPVAGQVNERQRDSDPNTDPDDDDNAENSADAGNDWPSIYNPLAVMRETPDFRGDVLLMDYRPIQSEFGSLEAVCNDLVKSGEWNTGYTLTMQLIIVQDPNNIILSVRKNIEESAGRDVLEELADHFSNLQIQPERFGGPFAEREAEIGDFRPPEAARLMIRIRFWAIDSRVRNHAEFIAMSTITQDEYVNRLTRDGCHISLNCTHQERGTCNRFLRPMFHNFIVRQNFNCRSRPVIFGIMCKSAECKKIYIGYTTNDVVDLVRMYEGRINHFERDHPGLWKFTPLVYASPIKEEMVKVRKAFRTYFENRGFELVRLEPRSNPAAH